MNSTFYNDVISGLRDKPKRLMSKYFYDEEGDVLFQQIMNSPEYYLTRCEMEIFRTQTAALAGTLGKNFDDFDIIELGAGDASKSIHLLQHLADSGRDFTYFPVDISDHIISMLEEQIPQKMKGQKVTGLNGEYFEMIKRCYEVSDRRKIVLFLGSSIGNMTTENATKFFHALHRELLPGDRVLIGFDLKKDPDQIRAAYNDKAGVTRAFNLNLLKRINRELDADFDTDSFMHYPSYDPVTGACRSFLVSRKEQDVTIDAQVISFKKHEPIYMELSQKYNIEEINAFAENAGFETCNHFFDSNEWFVDAVWECK